MYRITTIFEYMQYGSSEVVETNVPIVCLTRVWQPLFPLFGDKTFAFAIQTWQTSLEHYYMYVYVQTYSLSQLRKMLILLINSYCKRLSFPSKLGKHVRSTTTYMCKHILRLNSAKC